MGPGHRTAVGGAHKTGRPWRSREKGPSRRPKGPEGECPKRVILPPGAPCSAVPATERTFSEMPYSSERRGPVENPKDRHFVLTCSIQVATFRG